MRWPFVGNRRSPGARRGLLGFGVAMVLAIMVVVGWILSYTDSGEMGVIRESCLSYIGNTSTIDMEHHVLWMGHLDGKILITAARGRFKACDFAWHDSAEWKIEASIHLRSLERVSYYENPLMYSHGYGGFRFAGKRTPESSVLAVSVPYWSLMVGALGLVAYSGWKMLRKRRSFRGFESELVSATIQPGGHEKSTAV